MLSSEQLLEMFIASVSPNAPHRDYQRTVDHARWCYQMVTGDSQKDILVSYKVRETDKQQEQRIRITNSRTQYVSNKVIKLFNEVHRCDDVVESIAYATPNDVGLQELTTSLNQFYGGKPLNNYLDTRFRDLIFTDPNAYVITEFINDDPINKKPTVYPLEVSSAEVYDQKYINGTLQYIVTQHPVSYRNKKKSGQDVVSKRFTMYAAGYSFVLQHIPKEAVIDMVPEGYTEVRIPYKYDKDKPVSEETFWLATYETKNPVCPATRAGYAYDPTTNGRTVVSPMYPAEKIFTDLIWNKSEYDLSKALHGFYQKFAYTTECKDCDGSGHVTRDDNAHEIQCRKCKGTGKDIHTTVQDVVYIVVPQLQDGQALPPLSNFVHYATIPDSLINKQKEDYITDQKDVFNAIFGANVLDRTEMVETATAKHYDWRAVNNTLSEYADHRSETYKFLVRMTASIMLLGEGLSVQHSYPSDFKLESIQDLIDQRSSALSASAPSAVLSNIDLSILSKQYKDDPEFVVNFKAREKFKPFRDKSKEERSMLVSMLPSNDNERILYIYFERIMDDIFFEFPQFALMKYDKQAAIVKAKVEAKKLEVSVPTITQALTQPPPPITDDEE